MRVSLTIRRKLFLAFLGAAAVPLTGFLLIAHSYVSRTRADLDQRFLDQANAAFRRIDSWSSDKLDQLAGATTRLGHELREPDLLGPELPAALRPLVRDALSALSRLKQSGPRDDQAGDRDHDDRDDHDDDKLADPRLERLAKFRREHPAVRGLKLVLDGEPAFSDLSPDFTFDRAQAIASTMKGSTAEPFRVSSHGRSFLITPLDEDSWLYVEYDPAGLLEPAMVFNEGAAFYLSLDGQPRTRAESAAWLKERFPLGELAAHVPKSGTATTVVARGERFRLYAGVAANRPMVWLNDADPLIAVARESEIYLPLEHLQLQALAAVLGTIAIAFLLAYLLSWRFVGAVENLKRGMDALERGELVALEKSSHDELGGGLVERINRMATTLAERTRREEIESWRRLVRVLTHEINNTLGPVRSVAATVRDQVAPRLGDAGAAEDLQLAFRVVIDRVDTLSAFIGGYAELAKLPEPARAPCDLGPLASGAIAMERELAARRQVTVTEEHAPEALVLGDAAQLERVAINLVKNAVEAAATSVHVRTHKRAGARGAEGSVELTVEDDGPGIAPAARPQLFTPYFTTKPGGSGIGLALARQIVLAHGGTISAEDRPSGGALFRVVLPHGGGTL